jgi:SAM-dependent methyltransferase
MASAVAQTLQGAVKAARHYGVLASAGYVLDRMRLGVAERNERFDERHGTATDGKVYAWQLPRSDGAAIAGDIHPYEGTSAPLIRRVIRSLPISPSEFTFVDLGSGKGRALLVASEFSFPRVVGVELSRELDEIARSNVARYVRAVPTRSSFDLHCIDAAQYEFDNGPLVVYLFNPFGGPTFDAVISRLEESLRRTPRDVFVVYINPRFERRLRQFRMFKLLLRGGSRLRPWRRYAVYRFDGDRRTLAN